MSNRHQSRNGTSQNCSIHLDWTGTPFHHCSVALSVQIGPRRCVHASTHHIRVSTDHPLRYRASLTRARVGEQSIVHDPMLHSKFRMRSISHKKIHDSLSLSLYLIGLFVWDVGIQNKGGENRNRKYRKLENYRIRKGFNT